MKKKNIKTWIIWGIVIAVIITCVVLLLTVVNKKEEKPIFEIENSILVKYNGKDETVVIPSNVETIGKIAFKGNNKINTLKFENGSKIKAISTSAFEGCSALSSVQLPNTLETIGDYAFSDCVSLLDFVMPDSVKSVGVGAFDGCAQMSYVYLSQSLEKIGEKAFNSCVALSSIDIPSSVKNIGKEAFLACNSLTKIKVSSSNNNYLVENGILYTKDKSELIIVFDEASAVSEKTIQNDKGELVKVVTCTIDSAVKKICSNAFYKVSDITELVVSNNVTEIENNAFIGCTKLTKVTVPFIGNYIDSLSSFDSIFGTNDTSLLTEVVISQGTVINDKAFSGMQSIKSIELPNTITMVGEHAFSGCAKLSSITNFPTTLKVIGQYMFENCEALPNEFISSILTSTVEQIGEGAFSGCKLIEKIVLPSSVKHIAKGAFLGCTNITDMTIPFVGKGYEVNILDGTILDKFNTTTIFGHIFSKEDNFDQKDVIPSKLANLTITGDYDIVDRAFINCSDLKTISIPATVKKIGVEAFRNCSKIKTFDVPTSLEYIGASGFEGCTALTAFDLLKTQITTLSDNVFSSCVGLKELDITNITTIGKFALFNCKNLVVKISGTNDNYEVVDSILYKKGQTEIIRYPATLRQNEFTIPSTVKVICEGAFQNVSRLSTLIVPETVEEIELNAIVDCTNLESITLPFIGNKAEGELVEGRNTDFGCIFGGEKPEMLYVTITGGKVVDNDAFSNLAYVYSVELGSTFEVIGLSAFENCVYLESIIFDPNAKITTINERAFSKCSSLTSINIPASVTIIGDYAFQDCNQVTSVTLPKGLEELGVGAFKNWSSLTTVNIDDSNENYKLIDNAVFTADLKELIFYVAGNPATEYHIPEGVESMNSYAFSGAHSLTAVTFPESVKSVSAGLFYDCSAIESITLPSGVSEIPYAMFENCKSLVEVKNATGITVIGNRAFTNCAKLLVAPLNDSITEIGQNAFEGCAKITEVKLSEHITQIQKATFKDCKELTKVEFNDNITLIDDSAFENCTKFGNYVLPSKLEKIGQLAFSRTCSDRSLFADIDKIDDNGQPVLDKDGKVEKTPVIVNLVLPASLKEIGFRAFQGASYIDNVIIPEKIVTGDEEFDKQNKVISIAEDGVNCGAATKFYSKAIVVTINEETGDREPVYPENWISFSNMSPEYFGTVKTLDSDSKPVYTDEFSYNYETGELKILIKQTEE